MDQTLVTRIVEGALLAASQPLTVAQLSALFTLDEPAPDGSLQTALAELQAQCAERGVELVEVASGWRYQVKADVHPWVTRLWTERTTKYTRTTLETLALIAYRQPITRGEIEQIRGVATNSNIIKTLEDRDWIRVVGHRDVPGRPELLGTTKGFLDYFGLKRLDELPPLSELKDFGELDPQFNFDTAPIAANTPADGHELDGYIDADADAGNDENIDVASSAEDAADGDIESDRDAADADDGGTEAASTTQENTAEADSANAHPEDDANEDTASTDTETNNEEDIAADGEVRSH